MSAQESAALISLVPKENMEQIMKMDSTGSTKQRTETSNKSNIVKNPGLHAYKLLGMNAKQVLMEIEHEPSAEKGKGEGGETEERSAAADEESVENVFQETIKNINIDDVQVEPTDPKQPMLNPEIHVISLPEENLHSNIMDFEVEQVKDIQDEEKGKTMQFSNDHLKKTEEEAEKSMSVSVKNTKLKIDESGDSNNEPKSNFEKTVRRKETQGEIIQVPDTKYSELISFIMESNMINSTQETTKEYSTCPFRKCLETERLKLQASVENCSDDVSVEQIGSETITSNSEVLQSRPTPTTSDVIDGSFNPAREKCQETLEDKERVARSQSKIVACNDSLQSLEDLLNRLNLDYPDECLPAPHSLRSEPLETSFLANMLQRQQKYEPTSSLIAMPLYQRQLSEMWSASDVTRFISSTTTIETDQSQGRYVQWFNEAPRQQGNMKEKPYCQSTLIEMSLSNSHDNVPAYSKQRPGGDPALSTLFNQHFMDRQRSIQSKKQRLMEMRSQSPHEENRVDTDFPVEQGNAEGLTDSVEENGERVTSSLQPPMSDMQPEIQMQIPMSPTTVTCLHRNTTEGMNPESKKTQFHSLGNTMQTYQAQVQMTQTFNQVPYQQQDAHGTLAYQLQPMVMNPLPSNENATVYTNNRQIAMVDTMPMSTIQQQIDQQQGIPSQRREQRWLLDQFFENSQSESTVTHFNVASNAFQVNQLQQRQINLLFNQGPYQQRNRQGIARYQPQRMQISPYPHFRTAVDLRNQRLIRRVLRNPTQQSNSQELRRRITERRREARTRRNWQIVLLPPLPVVDPATDILVFAVLRWPVFIIFLVLD